MLGDHLLHPRRNRGRREHGLAANPTVDGWAEGDNLLNVLGKTLVEHLVRLVEHQVLDAAQTGGPIARKIKDSARAPDDDIRGVAQSAELGPISDTADAEHHAQCWIDHLDHRHDLTGQLSRGRDDERAGTVTVVAGKPLHHRDHECERLPRARRGLEDAVAALQQRGDRLALHCIRL